MSEQPSHARLRSPESASSPWQFPPDYLVQHVVMATILQPLHIASCRLVSRGWRATVDAALPLLVCRPFIRQDVVAELAGRFGAGLRILWLEPGDYQGNSHASLIVAHIASRCKNLVNLQLLCLGATDEAVLMPLASLPQLTSLRLSSGSLKLSDRSNAWLPPRLHSLDLSCESLASAGLRHFSGLQQLHLNARCPDWAVAVAQLTRLRSLSIDCYTQFAACHLHMLSSLAALTHLGLDWSRAELTGDWRPALTQLLAGLAPTERAIHHSAAPVASPAAGDRFEADTPAGAAGRGLHSLCLQRVNHVDKADPGLRFAELALSGLQALTWLHIGLVMDQPTEITQLAALTSLHFSFDSLPPQVPHDTMAALISQRLTNLQQLSLRKIYQVSESALEELSCLQQLTTLTLTQAHGFGGQALAALQPLTRLRRLFLQSSSLNDAGLADALQKSAGAAGAIEGGGPGPARGHVTLLPGLTYLSLSFCHHQLSAGGFVRMAAFFPSLRHLLQLDPQLKREHVQQVLDSCPQLDLFGTSWTHRFHERLSQLRISSLSASEQATMDEEEAFYVKYRPRLPHRYDFIEDDAVGALVSAGDTL